MLVPVVEPDPSPDRTPGLDARFGAFYEAERVAAARLVWLLTHDRAICDDIVHDAFTRVYLRFSNLDRPHAYLRIAIVNRVRELARSDGRDRRRLTLVTAGARTTTDGPTGGLADAVARLPLPQRTAIVLRYWGDLPDDEIAAVLDVRPGTVRSLLSRASATLRKELPQ